MLIYMDCPRLASRAVSSERVKMSFPVSFLKSAIKTQSLSSKGMTGLLPRIQKRLNTTSAAVINEGIIVMGRATLLNLLAMPDRL
jgi:hypothetical protein